MRRNLISASFILCALITPATSEASIVDPDKVTLSALTARAHGIVRAGIEPGPDRQLRFKPTALLGGRLSDLPGTFQAGAELAPRSGQQGLLFITRDPQGKVQVLAQEHGWIPDDPRATDFVTRLLGARRGGRQAVFTLLAEAAASPSSRVAGDAMRDLARFEDLLARLSAGPLGRLADAAARGLDQPSEREPAIGLLGKLPSKAGLNALRDAARRGLAPRLLGETLARHSGAIAQLRTSLELREAGLSRQEARYIAEVLGYSGQRQAVPELLTLLAESDLCEAGCRALARLEDQRALRPLKGVLLGSELAPAGAWAAVGLAYLGGPEAVGALEFAALNHRSARLRAFCKALLKDPAAARSELAGAPRRPDVRDATPRLRTPGATPGGE